MYARGMGEANCPSMSQLMGVDDPFDPCQGTAPPSDPILPTPSSCYPQSFVGPLPPGGQYCAAVALPVPIVATPAASCPSGSTCSIISGVPNTGVYVLAAIVASFLVYGAISK